MRPALSTIFVLFLAATLHGQTAKVAYVSDGDSFVIEPRERVRMIGVNAPELKDKFGLESKEHLLKLIRGKTVTLERDPLNQDRDIHGRLLRYVTLDNVDINRQMIADGYAYAFLRYRFSNERREAYREAEANAKAAKMGIWALDPGPDPSELPAPSLSVESNNGRPNRAEPSPPGPRSCLATFLFLLVTAGLVLRPKQ